MAKIRTLKLVTGEEIIATEVTLDPNLVKGTDLVLEKVRTIQMMPTGPGQVGVGLVPFSPSCIDGKVTLRLSAIVAEIEHNKEMEDAYLQQTSGIQLAGAGSIPTK